MTPTDADVDARLREAATRGLRCDVTGNLCGTDTWTVDWPCHCPNCARYLSHLVAELQQENERLRVDHDEATIAAIEAGREVKLLEGLLKESEAALRNRERYGP